LDRGNVYAFFHSVCHSVFACVCVFLINCGYHATTL
jgi:hypothetical protein